ncbi:MAG: hypothetical protein JWN10_31 [Solirubrobacterales bacterium]|nr:hypothetical protein [Solirubrobacterales bacterium]
MPKLLRRTPLVRRTLFAVPIALSGAALVLPAPASARGHRRATVEQPASEAPASNAPEESGTPTPASEPSLSTPPPSEPALLTRPEHVRRHGRCRVSLEASAHVVSAGETVTLLGRVSCPESKAGAGEQITIYQRDGAPRTALAQTSIATSGEDGSYELTTPPLTDKSVFVAESALGGRARTTIRVTPTVTLAGPAATGAELAARGGRVRGPNRFTFSGTVSPAGEGGHVALQSEYLGTGERWHTIARGRLDSEGHFSISRGFRAPGEVEVRVLSHVRGELVAASESLTYDVAPAQNPQLTIQASADPVLSGATVTITGVAAGAAGAPLTLLARTRGGNLAPVATGTSEAGGAYSFTATPTQNTTYCVRGANVASAALFVGVRYPLSAQEPAGAIQTGVPASFSGTVLTAPLGQVVYLERAGGNETGGNETGGGETAVARFHVVARGAVNAGFAYTIPYTFRHAGSYRMRVRVPADASVMDSTSEAFEVTVTGAASGAPETEEATETPAGAGD